MGLHFKFEVVDPVKQRPFNVIDRSFLVKRAGTDKTLFIVTAYSGNCCGVSTLSGVSNYADPGELAAALKWVSGMYVSEKNPSFFSWDMKSFIWFAGPGQHYTDKAKDMGMKEVFRFPSRSEPGHDVVQYFVDLSEGK